MADLRNSAICKVATKSGVNMQNGAGATTLYTVPIGKTFYPVMVIIRDLTASLADGTDYDFTNWRQTVSLTTMTTTGSVYRVIHSTDNTDYTELGEGTNFQITPSTGATAAATATIDVFGLLI